MGKRPAIQLYKGDWLRDPLLSKCSPQTRGIFIDLLCHLDDLDGQEMCGTSGELAQCCRCTTSQMRKAIAELIKHNVADIYKDDGVYLIASRRIKKDAKEREMARLRKQKERDGHGDVTDMSRKCHAPSSSSTSSSDIIHTQKADPHWPDPIIAELEKVWPEDARRSKAKIMEAVASAINASLDPDDARALMLKNAPLYLAECDREDRFVKHLQNWIADGDWSATYSEKPNAASRSKKSRIGKLGSFGQTFRAKNDQAD